MVVILQLLVLTGCNSSTTKIATNTPENINNNTPEPTKTYTATPSVTSTPEYYTEEENDADGRIWVAEEYSWPGFSVDWKSGSCLLLPQEVAGEVNQSLLHLSQPGGKLAFDHDVYTRISPNIWINEPSEAEKEYSTEGLTSHKLEILANQIILTTNLTPTTNKVVTCVNKYTLQPDNPSLPPTFTPTTLSVSQKTEITPGFYTEEEIAAQVRTWIVDFYQVAQLYTKRFSHCTYYEHNPGDFSWSLDFILPNPGEDLIIGELSYTRVAPNVWEWKMPMIPNGYQISTILEFSSDSIIETETVVSQINGTTTCVNEYFPLD